MAKVIATPKRCSFFLYAVINLLSGDALAGNTHHFKIVAPELFSDERIFAHVENNDNEYSVSVPPGSESAPVMGYRLTPSPQERDTYTFTATINGQHVEQSGLPRLEPDMQDGHVNTVRESHTGIIDGMPIVRLDESRYLLPIIDFSGFTLTGVTGGFDLSVSMRVYNTENQKFETTPAEVVSSLRKLILEDYDFVISRQSEGISASAVTLVTLFSIAVVNSLCANNKGQ